MTDMLGVGLHRDVPMDAYLGDELTPQIALSASGIRTLIEATPLAFAARNPRLWRESGMWPGPFKDRGTKSTKLGQAIHSMLLEDGGSICVIRPEDFTTAKGLPGKNLATKGAKEAIAEAEENGLMWITGVQEMQAISARDHALQKILRDPDYGEAWAKGESEVTMIWRRAVNHCAICGVQHDPIWCRGRIDRMAPREYGLMFDPKTTALSLHEDFVARRFRDQGTDFQAAWYQQGFEALHPEFAPDDPKFRLAYPWAESLVPAKAAKRRALYVPLSIEVTAPFDSRFTPFPPETIEWLYGKIDIACDLFAHCLSIPLADWPGWPNRELPSVRDYQIYKEMQEEAEEES
jgi:hypothetical protein